MKLLLALRLPLPITFSSTISHCLSHCSSCLFTRTHPSVLPAVLYYRTFQCTMLQDLKWFLYIFYILMYYLCEKCYKPITVEYNIADYVSYIPRLTFLDIRNKLDLGIHSQNRTPLYVGNLLYLCTQLSTVIQSVRVFKSLMCARHCGGCWRRAKRISCLCSVQTHSQKGHCPAQRRHPSGSF